MKCVCGYEGEDFNKFEKLEKRELIITAPLPVFGRGKGVDVYACPKCGTLKIEVEAINGR